MALKQPMGFDGEKATLSLSLSLFSPLSLSLSLSLIHPLSHSLSFSLPVSPPPHTKDARKAQFQGLGS
jgi:hypothetical protein